MIIASLLSKLMDFLCGLNEQQWFLVLVAAVVIGFILLRGFGSRSGY